MLILHINQEIIFQLKWLKGRVHLDDISYLLLGVPGCEGLAVNVDDRLLPEQLTLKGTVSQESDGRSIVMYIDAWTTRCSHGLANFLGLYF
jgi:hypothetical protein